MLLQRKFTIEALFHCQALTSLLNSAQLANAPTVPAPSTLVQTLGHAAPSAAVERVVPVYVRALLTEQDSASMDKPLVLGLLLAGIVQTVGWAVSVRWDLVVEGMFASRLTYVAERMCQGC